jgi:hypothetical protein
MENDQSYSLLHGFSNKKNKLTSLGGGYREGEKPIITAYREFMEEFFNVPNLPNKLIYDIIDAIAKTKGSIQHTVYLSDKKPIPSYTFFQFDSVLSIMGQYLNMFGINSFARNVPYIEIPNNVFICRPVFTNYKKGFDLDEIKYVEFISIYDIRDMVTKNIKYYDSPIYGKAFIYTINIHNEIIPFINEYLQDYYFI